VKRSAKPKWIRAKLPTEMKFKEINTLLHQYNLHTVCTEAFCPNRTECWESGTATFLLMGAYCTRTCRFCDVTTKNPHQYLDPEEPKKLAQAIKNLKLKYVVLTSVTRDDLPDGGANHLANCIKEIQKEAPNTLVEILIPDFRGNRQSLTVIVESRPQVIGHNIETTEIMTPQIRDHRADYRQSLQVLKTIKGLDKTILTKSSLMLGLGETSEQIMTSLRDLKKAEVDIITIGQYLQPSRKAIPVRKYIEPQKFEYWRSIAEEMGFCAVVAGPLVRSSFKAASLYSRLTTKTQDDRS
jgi:lipoic acid synthetase